MHIVLWIVAGLLSAVFFVGGVSKLVVPKESLAKFPAPWTSWPLWA